MWQTIESFVFQICTIFELIILKHKIYIKYKGKIYTKTDKIHTIEKW